MRRFSSLGPPQGKNKEKQELEVFYNWQCLSVIRDNNLSFDLVIEDEENLMAFIHYLHVMLYMPEDIRFMSTYRLIKIKMKIAYECWKRRVGQIELFTLAILRTL